MSAQVAYVLSETGVLDIQPSGNTLTINGGTINSTFMTQKVAASTITNGTQMTLTSGTLTGTMRLGASGGSITDSNRITALTELSSTSITSGNVSISGVTNTISGLTQLTAGSILSNGFSVASVTDSLKTVVTTTDGVFTKNVTIGDTITGKSTIAGSVATGFSRLNATRIESGDIVIVENNVTQVSSLSAATMTDGTSTLTGGSISDVVSLSMSVGSATTLTVGNSTWTTSALGANTLTNVTTLSAATMTDGTTTMRLGSLTGAVQVSATNGSLTTGTIGGMTLATNNLSNISSLTMKTDVNSQITGVASLGMLAKELVPSSITNGSASWVASFDDTNTLSGVTTVSAGTITDGTTTMQKGSITGLTTLTSTAASISSCTLGVAGVTRLTAATLNVGESVYKGTIGGSSGITGLSTLNATTITDGTTTMTSGTISSVASFSGTTMSMTSASITTLTVGGNTSVTGTTTFAAISATSATIGGMSFLGGTDNVISNATTIESDTFTSSATTLTNNTITGLVDCTLSGSLKADNVLVVSNNMTGISDITCVNATASTLITAGGYKNTANRFTVSHDAGVGKTTTTSDIFTDGSLSLTAGTLSNVKSITGATVSALSGFTSATLAGTTLTHDMGEGVISGVKTFTMNSLGIFSGASEVSASILKATSATGTSTISGNLRVEGDLKVINNSASVIELQHEKFSTQDPVIEFNTRLDGKTAPLADMNVDFGFMNICEDATDANNKVFKSAGLVSDVTDSDDMAFTFFHSGAYTPGATNNSLPETYTLADVRCKNIMSDGYVSLQSPTASNNYIAIGAGRGTESVYTTGNARVVGTLTAGAVVSTNGYINIGTDTRVDEAIITSGKIKALSIQTQNFTQTSDVRKKDNVVSIDDSVSKLEKLRPVTFDWKTDGSSDVGFIAQEVMEVYPELVKQDGTGHYSVAYTGLVAPLVRAIQQQQEMIKALVERVSILENREA